MTNRTVLLTAISVSLLSLLTAPTSYLIHRLSVLGLFRWNTLPNSFTPSYPLSPSHTSEIQFLTAATGCEDLHLHKSSGSLFAACQKGFGRRKEWFPPLELFSVPPTTRDGAGDGTLVVIDPETLRVTHLDLIDFSLPFITHGIDLCPSPSDPSSIYIHAVNHLPSPEYISNPSSSIVKAASQVEIFHHVLGSTTARHVRSVAHEGIITPNDIFSLAPGSFYVTNDHKYREGLLRGLEDLGGERYAPWTNTVLVDADLPVAGGGIKPAATEGVRASTALGGMHNNNGIGRTDIEGEIVINSAAGGVLSIGRIDPATNNITVVESMQLRTALDNPSWYTDEYTQYPSSHRPSSSSGDDDNGEDASGLILAGLAQGLPYLATHFASKSSGVVWHLRPRAPTPDPQTGKREWHEPRPIYKSDGNQIEMITTAVLVGIDPEGNEGKKQGRLFVTSPFARGVIVTVVDL